MAPGDLAALRGGIHQDLPLHPWMANSPASADVMLTEGTSSPSESCASALAECILEDLSKTTLALIYGLIAKEGLPEERSKLDARLAAVDRPAGVVSTLNPWRSQAIGLIDRSSMHAICIHVGAEDAACAREVCRAFAQGMSDAFFQREARVVPRSTVFTSVARAEWALHHPTIGHDYAWMAPTWAASHGALDALRTLVANVAPPTRSTVLAAVAAGHVHILDFLYDQAVSRHVHIPDFVDGRRGPFGLGALAKDMLTAAAGAGQLHVLDWVNNVGYPSEHVDAQPAAAAARHGHLAELIWLVSHGCPMDMTVAAAAAEGSHLKVLRWAREYGCPWDERTCAMAAKAGALAVLEYARQHGCPWNGTVYLCAAENGHLHVIRWVFAHDEGEMRSTQVCEHAARGGHLDVLQWLRAHSFPWDEKTSHSAARSGHLEVLQWARASGCPWNPMQLTSVAAEMGHLHVLVWALDQGMSVGSNGRLIDYAARGGHVPVIHWARSVGCAWGVEACAHAAAAGHLATLRYLRSGASAGDTCPWDPSTCASAAGGGHLEVLVWARENGCPWDKMTCYFAAARGHLDILRWARTHGCPWTNRVCHVAAEQGHLEVLQWARAHFCPWDVTICRAAAVANQHQTVALWIEGEIARVRTWLPRGT